VSETIDDKISSKTPETPPRQRAPPRDSLDNEADPWASPAAAKTRTQKLINETTPQTNGTTTPRPISITQSSLARTTSIFTTTSEQPDSSRSDIGGSQTDVTSSSVGGAWGGYSAGAGFANGDPSALGPGGFGSGGDDPNNPLSRPSRVVGAGRTTNQDVEETVTIATLPGKEGMFLFQHRNYEVRCARRASTVIRRYSDFAWLLDCLHKRYPFRQLPLLPPKTLAGKFSRAIFLADSPSLTTYPQSMAGTCPPTSLSLRKGDGASSDSRMRSCVIPF
jgi:sorting nexin-8